MVLLFDFISVDNNWEVMWSWIDMSLFLLSAMVFDTLDSQIEISGGEAALHGSSPHPGRSRKRGNLGWIPHT